MEDDGILLTEGRDDWINWLVNNHHGDKGIWLHIRKKKAPPPGVYYEDALEEALCFGWIDGKMKSLNPQGFMVRFTPRRPGSLWSARNRYIFHITMAKTPGTRTKRIRMVIDRAARNIKPGF